MCEKSEAFHLYVEVMFKLIVDTSRTCTGFFFCTNCNLYRIRSAYNICCMETVSCLTMVSMEGTQPTKIAPVLIHSKLAICQALRICMKYLKRYNWFTHAHKNEVSLCPLHDLLTLT